MTREEIIKVIGIITTAYPNFDKFRDEKHIRSMVAIWADMFSEDDAGLVALSVKEYISTSKWPPSIAEIREIMVRIKSGEAREVARVIKGLMSREARRGLSTVERKMLRSAKQILLSEVMLVEDISYDGAEQLLSRSVLAE